MTCEPMAPLLDDFLDGNLPAAERAQVEAHLATCPTCRAEVDALRSVLTDAREMPRSVMPARDLWSGIAGRLGDSALKDSLVPGRPAGSLRDSVAARRLVLQMAAAVALLVAGAALATLVRSAAPASAEFAAAQRRYTRETAELARQVAAHPDALPESTRAVVERNLAIVDAAILEAEQALTADPGNTALEAMILARYEQRLALLTRATAAGRRSL